MKSSVKLKLLLENLYTHRNFIKSAKLQNLCSGKSNQKFTMFENLSKKSHLVQAKRVGKEQPWLASLAKIQNETFLAIFQTP